ncbi:dihydrofolate reductase [Methylobacterium sp. NEAU 140]|uniref:dihydrofolate reductase n=1 Tax=Methylobacterium sp. NEAU 140 TaxID=3064945 RepID=UPI002737155C|nr:dihydrofolate reductase [Methylobacterium sp. NEAU 140]MDP4021949.1 dihydrofolate reductase [Methylobacterium sp. NEAU 140]
MRRPSMIALVAAVARNGVIGRDNGLAWHLSSDLKRFKALTMGRPILMGRRTWDSIGRPLPGRRTLVLTRDAGFSAAGSEVVHGWDAALAAAADATLMVVGGAEIYALALPEADRIHLTEVEAEPAGDARFPAFDRANFRETLREAHPAGPRDAHPFAFVDLERIR